MKRDNFETLNQKVTRYFLITIAVLGIVITVATIPKNDELNNINQEIASTNKEIAAEKKDLQKNSPANVKNKYSLYDAEAQVSDSLDKAIQACLGGAKNQSEFDDQRPDTEQVLSKKIVDQLYKLNGNPEEVVNNPKHFDFILDGNKTSTLTTFDPVTDVRRVNAISIITTKNKNNKENIYKLSMTYDLSKGKVVKGKLASFDDPNLTGNMMGEN